MNPPLEIRVCAGFANRLRALVSAMCAAEDIVPLNPDGSRPVSLIVSWVPEMNIHTAPFDFLFDSSSLPRWVRIEDGRVPAHSGWNSTTLVLSQDDWNSLLERVRGKRPLRIKSYAHFYKASPERWLKHLRMLKPSEMIQVMIDDVISSVLPGTSAIVGVHIRRGDNKKSIEESPSELFWSAMAKYEPSVCFYLATDSNEERFEACRRFPNRILMGSETILSRNDPFGCREAVVDFFCLSRCSEILGSYYSSFSEMSALYGDVPLTVMKASA
jgi:hypothetical protein